MSFRGSVGALCPGVALLGGRAGMQTSGRNIKPEGVGEGGHSPKRPPARNRAQAPLTPASPPSLPTLISKPEPLLTRPSTAESSAPWKTPRKSLDSVCSFPWEMAVVFIFSVAVVTGDNHANSSQKAEAMETSTHPWFLPCN